MKEVLVPDHIAREVEAEKSQPEEEKTELDQAYVKSDDRVLDPTLLDKSYLERMPQPTGWRLLILPYKGKAVTKGGIVLAKETVQREGARFKLGDDAECRIINDDEVIAIIEDPDDIVSV